MKSNLRVFKEKGLESSRGKLLSLDEFRLCSDMPSTEIDPEIGDRIVALAEPMLEEELPLLPLSSYRDFALTGVRSRFEKNHHRRRKMLLTLTMAEAYERKGRFVEKTADIIWAMLEESCWIIPAHYSSSVLDPETSLPEIYREDQMPGLDLYAASACAHLSVARYFLRRELDAISPVICKRIDHQVYLRGVRPFISYPFWWSGEGGGKVNNWVTNITSHVLLATAICIGDMELREKVVDKAIRYLDNFTADYPADGYCDEGPGYWDAAGGNYFDCLELIEDMSGGKITVYDSEFVKKLGEYICALHVSGEDFACFADCRPKLLQPGKMLIRFGKKCSSEALVSFGRTMALSEDVNVSCLGGLLYRNVKDAVTPLIHENNTPSVGVMSSWFADGKLAVLREKEKNGEGFYLAFKGGHNRESHNHNDVGCIVVYKDGKPLIVDPSNGSYDHKYFDWSYRYLRWFTNSDYHSVPSVNGIPEKVGQSFASSDEVFDEASRTVSMELGGAFPGAAGISSMRRTCHMGDGFLTVEDRVELKECGDISYNYTLYGEPRVLSEGVIDLGGATLEFDPRGIEVVIERVENKTLPYDDLNFKAVWGTECLWRLCLKTRAASHTLTATIR